MRRLIGMLVIVFFGVVAAQKGAITDLELIEKISPQLSSYENLGITQEEKRRSRIFEINVLGNDDLVIPTNVSFDAPNGKIYVDYSWIGIDDGSNLENRLYAIGFVTAVVSQLCFSITDTDDRAFGKWFAEKIESVKNARDVTFERRFGKISVKIVVTRYAFLDEGMISIGFQRFDAPGTPAWPKFCTLGKG